MNIPSDDRGIETGPSTPEYMDKDHDGIVDDALGGNAASEEVGSD